MRSIHFILCLYALITKLCLILCSTEVFRESLEGVVEACNYSHYSYNGEYQISIVVRTLEGDADLYVSRADGSGRAVKPNYEWYDLHSVTCGDDRVDIPHEFGRPIGISVYGHPSHEISIYTLDVIAYANNDSDTTGQYLSEEELRFYEEFFGEPYSGINRVPNNKRNRNNEHNNSNENTEKRSDFWEFVISILGSILQILFEVIV